MDDRRETRRVTLLRAIDAQVRAHVLREKAAWLQDDAAAVIATSKRVRAQAGRRSKTSARTRRRYKTSRRAA
jgi:hypothetical protein